MRNTHVALGAVIAVAAPLSAQPRTPAVVTTLPAAPLSAPIAEQPTANAILRAGTPINLRLMEEVTTKKKAAKVGQRFQLEVAAPVEVNGVVVIPAGAPAWGEITEVRNKGMWGKSGKLTARLLFVRVNGRQVRLTGSFDDKGVTGTAGVVGSIALVPIAGFFVTGTSAVLPMGGAVNGFIDEDVALAMSAAPQAPMQVIVPTSVSAPSNSPVPAPGTSSVAQTTPAAMVAPTTPK